MLAQAMSPHLLALVGAHLGVVTQLVDALSGVRALIVEALVAELARDAGVVLVALREAARAGDHVARCRS